MADVTTQDRGGSSAAQGAAAAVSDVADQAASAARSVTETASAQAADVRDDVRQQLGTVSDEARQQASRVVSSATSEVQSQLEDRLQAASSAARSTVEELKALCDGRPEDAGRSLDLVRQASDRLEHLADRADDLGARGVAEEVVDFARRRPMAFLGGALVAGVVVGRLARAGRDVTSGGGSSSSSSAGSQGGGISTLGAGAEAGGAATGLGEPMTLDPVVPTAVPDPISPVTAPPITTASVAPMSSEVER